MSDSRSRVHICLLKLQIDPLVYPTDGVTLVGKEGSYADSAQDDNTKCFDGWEVSGEEGKRGQELQETEASMVILISFSHRYVQLDREKKNFHSEVLRIKPRSSCK